MSKFKKGDRVVLLAKGGKYEITYESTQKPGDTGTVTGYSNDWGECVCVDWDNRSPDPKWVEDLLDLIETRIDLSDYPAYYQAITERSVS